MSKITKCKIRMYRAGTGDCFILKFYAGKTKKFTMMIDGGVWKGSKTYLAHFVQNIKETTGGIIDLLVITHEHLDHVLMFERCEHIFKDFIIEELWFGWTENDSDKKVKEWKKKYGDRKIALKMVADKLNNLIVNKNIENSLKGNFNAKEMYNARVNFSEIISGFSELHISEGDNENIYKGALKGMHVIKNKLNIKKIKFLNQGEIVKNIKNLPGIKFYILGPPDLYDQVNKESGKEGETYNHNKDLDEHELFSLSVQRDQSERLKEILLPFERSFIDNNKTAQSIYEDPIKVWRKIDYEWLFSAGNLSLRMNSLTNNLSLAFAIEFEESKKVMLFPGDAEIGSWESWHKIKWPEKGANNKHLTEDLLNRTVFYKVAHHLSHNGTAQSLGMELMEHTELTAMATIDYSNISNGWKNTMPNKALLKELLKRTKGRLIIQNEDNIYYDLNDKIKLSSKIKDAKESMNSDELTSFTKNLAIPKPKLISYQKGNENVTEEKILYFEYTVSGE